MFSQEYAMKTFLTLSDDDIQTIKEQLEKERQASQELPTDDMRGQGQEDTDNGGSMSPDEVEQSLEG